MLVADDLAVSHLFVVNVLCTVVPSNDEKVPAAMSSRFPDFHSLRHQFKSISVQLLTRDVQRNGSQTSPLTGKQESKPQNSSPSALSSAPRAREC